MNVTKTREQIKLIIAANDQADVPIDELLGNASTIAGYMVYLQAEEAKAHRAYLMAYNSRKVAEAEYHRKNVTKGLKIGEASNLAIEQTRGYRNAEADYEAEWKDCQTFRIVVLEYLDTLRQRISWLKKEFDNQNNQA